MFGGSRPRLPGEHALSPGASQVVAPSQLLQAQSANNSNGVLGFETSWLDQRAWIVTVATVLLAAIVVLRFAIVDPTEPVLVLCVVPIALIAIEFGTIGGLAAATFCFCVALGYSLITGYAWASWAFSLAPDPYTSWVRSSDGSSSNAWALEERHTRWFAMARDLSCTAGFDGCFKSVNPAWRERSATRPRRSCLDRSSSSSIPMIG